MLPPINNVFMMRMEWVTKCSIFSILWNCETNPVCGSSRNKEVTWQQPTLNWIESHTFKMRMGYVMKWSIFNILRNSVKEIWSGSSRDERIIWQLLIKLNRMFCRTCTNIRMNWTHFCCYQDGTDCSFCIWLFIASLVQFIVILVHVLQIFHSI